MSINYDELDDDWLQEQPIKKDRLSKRFKKTMKNMRKACDKADKYAEKVTKNNWKSMRKNKGDTLG